jgi:hypothetical protein
MRQQHTHVLTPFTLHCALVRFHLDGRRLFLAEESSFHVSVGM